MNPNFNIEISEDEEKRRGELIVKLLGLRKTKEGILRTSVGTKTALGLFRTVKRIILDGE